MWRLKSDIRIMCCKDMHQVWCWKMSDGAVCRVYNLRTWKKVWQLPHCFKRVLYCLYYFFQKSCASQVFLFPVILTKGLQLCSSAALRPIITSFMLRTSLMTPPSKPSRSSFCWQRHGYGMHQWQDAMGFESPESNSKSLKRWDHDCYS